MVKDAGPPSPVRSLAGELDSDMMEISVTWAPPAGFLDGSSSSLVPFDAARKSGGGNPGTAVIGYDYEYQRDGSATWTQGTTTSTSLKITGVEEGDAYTVRVRARNAEGAGSPVTIDVLHPMDDGEPEPEPEPEPVPVLPVAGSGLLALRGAWRLARRRS